MTQIFKVMTSVVERCISDVFPIAKKSYIKA